MTVRKDCVAEKRVSPLRDFVASVEMTDLRSDERNAGVASTPASKLAGDPVPRFASLSWNDNGRSEAKDGVLLTHISKARCGAPGFMAGLGEKQVPSLRCGMTTSKRFPGERGCVCVSGWMVRRRWL